MDFSQRFAGSIAEALQSVIGFEPTTLHSPSFEGNEWKYVKDCIDSTYVSSVGEYVNKLETELASYTGAQFAVAVSNGTSALHVALIVGGVKRGDEVLLPSLSFVATANAVSYVGAVPNFVDSDFQTLGMDVEKLYTWLKKFTNPNSGACINRASGRQISAIVPMHTFGHPVEMERLTQVAEEFHLKIIEDAAESLGTTYFGKHLGTFGELGALSFNGNKIITTGGGGAILTDSEHLYTRAKHLTTTAKQSHPWEYFHNETGFNYRMPNINAALGCAQLEDIEIKVKRKRELFETYKSAFAAIPGVTLFAEPENSRSNYWLNTLILDSDHASMRDEVIKATHELGIGTRPAWQLLSSLPMYLDSPRTDLTTAEELQRRVINIPSSAFSLESTEQI